MSQIAVHRDVSRRGAVPSVCYEVVELGPRGAHLRTLLRTPRRFGKTEDEGDRQTAETAAAALAKARGAEGR